MRRALISWSVAFALLFAAFGITVASLAGTIYSAGGFVRSYLDAVGRHDTTTALHLPGVAAAPDAATDLLTASAIDELSDIRLIADYVGSDEVHTVSYEYTLGGKVEQSNYRVQQTGAFLGMFPTWRFESSPLATIAVSVLHDARFRGEGIPLTIGELPPESPGYVVFTPGLYTFDHESAYLTADPITAPVTEPGGVTAVQLDVQANDELVSQVDKELRAYLDACATQEVLQPTGCPFGKTFENRLDSTPKWSMSTYPSVEIIPGTETGTWLMPSSESDAHLTVDVRSLFDGSITKFDEDVPFTVAYAITIGTDDSLTIDALEN